MISIRNKEIFFRILKDLIPFILFVIVGQTLGFINYTRMIGGNPSFYEFLRFSFMFNKNLLNTFSGGRYEYLVYTLVMLGMFLIPVGSVLAYKCRKNIFIYGLTSVFIFPLIYLIYEIREEEVQCKEGVGGGEEKSREIDKNNL